MGFERAKAISPSGRQLICPKPRDNQLDALFRFYGLDPMRSNMGDLNREIQKKLKQQGKKIPNSFDGVIDTGFEEMEKKCDKPWFGS